MKGQNMKICCKKWKKKLKNPLPIPKRPTLEHWSTNYNFKKVSITKELS